MVKLVVQSTSSSTMNVQQDSDYNHFFNDYNKRVCAEVNSVLWTMI